MTRTIKIGGMTVEVPDDSPLASGPVVESPAALLAEKPDEPEKLSSSQYVYRPNDPFQSEIDRVVVLGNVHSAGKPWVRKVFLTCFVILPFTFAEIIAIGALFTEPPGRKLSQFLFYTGIGLIVGAPYLLIWWAQKPKKRTT
jgi:hypothetical protein